MNRVEYWDGPVSHESWGEGLSISDESRAVAGVSEGVQESELVLCFFRLCLAFSFNAQSSAWTPAGFERLSIFVLCEHAGCIHVSGDSDALHRLGHTVAFQQGRHSAMPVGYPGSWLWLFACWWTELGLSCSQGLSQRNFVHRRRIACPGGYRPCLGSRMTHAGCPSAWLAEKSAGRCKNTYPQKHDQPEPSPEARQLARDSPRLPPLPIRSSGPVQSTVLFPLHSWRVHTDCHSALWRRRSLSRSVHQVPAVDALDTGSRRRPCPIRACRSTGKIAIVALKHF